MRIGVVFPQTEITADPAAVRDFAQAAEGLGFDHLLVYDHVLGAKPSKDRQSGVYTHNDMFHEVFVMLGFIAGFTSRIELATGILVLPQRQTALAAKQAAEVDVLSGGRMRLGIGVGWNPVEFGALGEDFSDRGARCAEQIELLRALWTQELVTFEGRWHKVTDAGLDPLPVQRPIPIWIGGGAEQTLSRIGRLGDGWIYPGYAPRPDDEARRKLDTIGKHADEAGRDRGQIGLEKVFGLAEGPLDELAGNMDAWKQVGATHVSVSTMGAGLRSPDEHIEAIRRIKGAVQGV